MGLLEQDTLEGKWYIRNSISGYKGQPEAQKHGLSGNGNYIKYPTRFITFWVITAQLSTRLPVHVITTLLDNKVRID